MNKVVQDFDAFAKIPESYVEKTNAGASISFITFFLVALLLWSEMSYFFNPGFTFKFVPDTDMLSTLSINVDLTIAMPCNSIGADILDSTNQNTFSFGRLQEDDTWFELDSIQRQHFNSVRDFNEYLREEYHAVQDLMWRSGQSSFYGDLPQRRTNLDEPHDACRIHGSLRLNKVAGNFHITAGKSIPLMRGHAHLTAFLGPQDYNFSHRIDRFSFGTTHGGIVQPLEGDEKIAEESKSRRDFICKFSFLKCYFNSDMMNYQYFVQVVPTDVEMVSGFTHSTYQYSVKEQERAIDHNSDSHGTPGIYFKYDMSALKVKVKQDRESIPKFLVSFPMICITYTVIIALLHFRCAFAPGSAVSWPRHKSSAD